MWNRIVFLSLLVSGSALGKDWTDYVGTYQCGDKHRVEIKEIHDMPFMSLEIKINGAIRRYIGAAFVSDIWDRKRLRISLETASKRVEFVADDDGIPTFRDRFVYSDSFDCTLYKD